MGILALCCCCSCWIFGGRLPADDGILSRDREREKDKDKEMAPLAVVPGIPVAPAVFAPSDEDTEETLRQLFGPVNDSAARLPLIPMNDNARL